MSVSEHAAFPDFSVDRSPWDDTYWSREETLDRAALRTLQDERFRATLAYAWASNPWYRELWSAAGLSPDTPLGLDDIGRLPFVTKPLIRQSQADAPPYGLMLAQGLDQGDVVRLAMTSGTTGKPVLIPFTRRDYALWMEGVVRALWAAGVRRTDVVHAAFGFTPFVGLFGAHDAAERWIGATVIPGGAWDSAIRINMLPFLGVTVLLGTPTYLLRLGRLAVEQGHDLSTWPVKKLFVTGEVGPASSPATGQRLAELWHAEVHEFCGTQETNYFAWDCDHGHFHWNEDLVYAEVLDPVTRQPVPEGQPGELVVTDLLQRTHPLVRFPTGDLVAGFETVSCGCGRGFRHFKGFIGRIDDVAKIRGVSVAQSGIEHAIRSHPGTSDDYDIEFWSDADGLDQVRIRVEPRAPQEAEGARALARALEEQLHRTLFVTMKVEVVPPGTLPRFDLKAKRIRDNRRRPA
ncbi:AMP-binding protein [Xanthobacter sp. V4C-4]|uniref:phenylacetate--CoA ligase family protein n=1 Tax=Xanthobacter cornucopiae TaxID=3119924 RepID=UPI003727977E